MTDIAEIGFKADTSDLSDAKIKLDKLAPSAAKVEGNVDRLNNTMERLITTMERSVGRAAKGKTANDNLSKSYTGLGTTMERVNRVTGVSNKSAMSAGAGYEALGQKLDMLRAKHNPLFAVIQRYKMNLSEIRAANASGAISVDEMTAAIKRQRRAALTAISAIKANGNAVKAHGIKSGAARHNIGNLAAQFQDVGVTAAMGMNPMMVALQQGTQISAILGPLGLSGALKTLAASFRAVFSPMSLLVIVMTALAVVGVQMVKWSELAIGTLNGLANILPTVAVYATAAAVGLALMYAPTIVRGMIAMPGMVWKAVMAFRALAISIYATLGLPILLVAGFLAIVAAANVFRDELTNILGFDIVGAAKKAVNFIIGVFVGGFNAVKTQWKQLPELFGILGLMAANAMLNRIKEMGNGVIAIYNKIRVKFGKEPIKMEFNTTSISKTLKEQLGETDFMKEIGKAQGVDYVGGIVAGIKSGANKAADKLRGIAKGIAAGKKDSDGKTDAEKFADIKTGAGNKIRSIQAEIRGLNLTSEAARQLKNETTLLNQARQKGLKLTKAQKGELTELATKMSALQENLKNEQAFKTFNEDLIASTRALSAERYAIGLVGIELDIMRGKTELLAKIKKQDIKLTEGQVKVLDMLLAKQAKQTATNKALKSFIEQRNAMRESILTIGTEIEALGKTKEAAAALRFERKLLNDEMFRGIAYSPAQTEALKKEAAALFKLGESYDKLKEKTEFARSTTKKFFQDLQSGIAQGQSLIKTFADSVVSALNRIIDKLLDKAFDKLLDGFLSGDTGKSSGGGFFGKLLGNIGKVAGGKKFAKGGTFTNGIVNSPTLFKFAKGTGLMGEAGPEAIVPLKRGSDGSLGVQMFGGGGKGGQQINAPININQTFTLEGAISSNDVLALTKEAANQSKEEVKRSLTVWLAEQQIDGAVV